MITQGPEIYVKPEEPIADELVNDESINRDAPHSHQYFDNQGA
jgi:hypothetical protein